MDIPNEISFRPHKPLRRDFLRVGSLSLLGMHLSEYLGMQSAFAATGGRTNPNAKAQACIMLWARRRAESSRHLGSETQQQLQTDLDERGRHSDL